MKTVDSNTPGNAPGAGRAADGRPEPDLDELRAAGIDVDSSSRRRSEYSYDASNYRVPPLAVVFPRTAEDVAVVARFAHTRSLPLTSRGGGTSMAGNAIGTGLVLDFSRHMHGIRGLDRRQNSIVAEAGVVITALQDHVERATAGALTFAPDPSSKSRATIGGAVGNDACGNHSVRYGRTSDHVLELQLVTAEGYRLTAGPRGVAATDPQDGAAVAAALGITAALSRLAGEYLAPFRLDLGTIPRQVSGYHLAELLPENHFNVARALVGSEGTCVIVISATLRLVPKPARALLLCLGYPDVVEAARDVPDILGFNPAAIEGIDDAIVKTMQYRRGADSVRGLPAGNAFLYVDLDGEDADDVAAQADALLAALRRNGRIRDAKVVPDPGERASLWRVREDGAGLAARLYSGEGNSGGGNSGGESWPGWEDSAVAVDRLADYLSDFRDLLQAYALQGVLYGHFGAGCMHVRITFDLRSDEGRGVFDRFVRAAAELVVRHGGSLSGEHGDGRARSALLPVMYSPVIMESFRVFKAIWDPANLLNPGSVVEPAPITADLALAGIPERQWRTSFELAPAATAPEGLDPFVHAVQGCIGVGRCRSSSGGVMCPSFRATSDEKDSTRGRARVLQDMVRSSPTVAQGWKSEDVREALDLCLSCKACATDCPVGVDMATYKSEFFDHFYTGRFRPRSHYALGWLPRWLKLTGRIAPLVNAVMAGPAGRLLAQAAGLTTHRAFPKFAGGTDWQRGITGQHRTADPAVKGSRTPPADVVLCVDSFTRGFRPEVAGAAQRVLASAGRTAECTADACCGLTWISTGQLGTARKLLARAAATLDDGSDRPIIVLEPSCAAALKKDLPDLVRTDQARRVARRVRSFAAAVSELAADGWRPVWPGGAAPQAVTVQTHCHEYSVFGERSQQAALRAVGITDIREATGCCGVAGNFGFETEHYEISMKVAEQALLPALAATPPTTPVLTDGFSCLMQVAKLEPNRNPYHLAQLLDPEPTVQSSQQMR
ncbi:FAD-binding oxidoreductase [Paeniglutamicibacter antarcticus]|uniref:FAD-binding oxidoreductase n=1 Tax=Arthrobacter terrae TaxID=2935737 RepID=A0A931G903_9MICC|nr:FAD-binding and (Fe-S)-binding domain-containing protein [Arthrobacter terrae]MBG0738222.1 FAD-binding oxidoreductase [Arthrobacter terrae]